MKIIAENDETITYKISKRRMRIEILLRTFVVPAINMLVTPVIFIIEKRYRTFIVKKKND